MSITTARSSLAVHNGGVSTVCNGGTIFTQADTLGTDALDTVITGLKNAARPAMGVVEPEPEAAPAPAAEPEATPTDSPSPEA